MNPQRSTPSVVSFHRPFAIVSGRYVNVDGLRAIAALSVMVEHMFGDLQRHAATGVGPMRTTANTLEHSVSLGRFGVTLFFLISGFVVPFSFRGRRPLSGFVLSRLFRLYPALWLALAVLTVTASWHAGTLPSTATVLANMTLAPNLFGEPWLSPIYWTLFVELSFYVLVAALFAAGMLWRVEILSILAFALITSTVLPILLRINGLANLPVQYLGLHLPWLFFGLLLRLALVEGRSEAKLALPPLLVAQFGGILAIAHFSIERGDKFIIDGYLPVLTAYGLAFVTFWASITYDKPRSTHLARLGLISYGIYLFHWIVDHAIYRSVPLKSETSEIFVIIFCMICTVMFAELVHRMVERPAIAIGRRIVNWNETRE